MVQSTPQSVTEQELRKLEARLDELVHTIQRLKEEAEKAKIELSSAQQTEVNLPYITADASGPKHLSVSITRSKFEQLIDQFLSRIKKPMEQALSDVKLLDWESYLERRESRSAAEPGP